MAGCILPGIIADPQYHELKEKLESLCYEWNKEGYSVEMVKEIDGFMMCHTELLDIHNVDHYVKIDYIRKQIVYD